MLKSEEISGRRQIKYKYNNSSGFVPKLMWSVLCQSSIQISKKSVGKFVYVSQVRKVQSIVKVGSVGLSWCVITE